jgi:hypothetical protein
MKKFLSIFVALAMVLSLFAGVGARTAKAATALTFTSVPATLGTFAGGVDEVTVATGVYGVGTVTSLSPPSVNVTTAQAGTFGAVTRTASATLAAVTTPFGPITPAAGATADVPMAVVAGTIVVGDSLTIGAGVYVETVAAVTSTVATLTFETAAVIAGGDAVALTNDPVFAATTTDTGWKTLGIKPISVSVTTGYLHVGDVLHVAGTTVAAAAAVAAKAVITIGGTVTPGNTVRLVVNNKTVDYTVPTFGATPTTIATALAALVEAATILPGVSATSAVAALTLTADVAGIVGNTYGYSISEIAPAPSATVPQGTVTVTPTQVAGTTNVLLSWTYSVSPTDVTAFRIYRNGAVIAYVAPSPMTYTDASTVAGTFYSYYIMPVNGNGDGTQSFSASIVPAAVIPVIPGAAATSTLTLTPSGNFAGGVDGTSTTSTNAVGTVGTDLSVTVTTAGVGAYYGSMSVSTVAPNVYSTDANWDLTGYQWVNIMTTATALTAFPIGSKIAVAGTSTNGVGTVIAIGAIATPASATSVALSTNPFGAGVAYNNIPLYVNISTAVVGVIGTTLYNVATVKSAFSTNWLTLGKYASMGFTLFTPAAGQLITVNMEATDEGQYATAFLIVSGTPVKGDIATVTWQDTLAASHTVSYTTITGDTAAKVAAALTSLINNLDATTGNVSADLASPTVIQLTQDVAGVAGNGKTLTATTTAAVTPTLTIHTLGGLTSPAYVELGKTIQLVAVDATGATVTAPFALTSGTSATVSTTGLVTAASVASNLTGVSVITATSGTATGVFAVIVVPVQVITSLTINLVPALPVSTTSQQFGAIASNAAYSALDYTTQAVWTDALPVASIKATTGLLTYSTDETGNVYASAGGITATANVKIATGVVTLVTTVGPVTKVIVLTIGSDIVTIDDKATTVDAAPEIVDGRTFVPIRFIAETFGSTVTWLPETKGVTIVLGDTTIGLQIGNATAVINGTIIALEAAPYIKNSRTMVPLRVISESFGGNVAWDPINHIITITYVLPVVLPAA